MSGMGSQPLDRYRSPDYPTRAELAADADGLTDHLPAAWSADGRLAGAVAFFFALSGSGCGSAHQPDGRTAVAPASTPTTGSTSAPAVDTSAPVVAIEPPAPGPGPEPTVQPALSLASGHAPAALAVAPLFEHGDGAGATGCVVVAPPVFLSEEEALALIRQELERHGIELSKTDVPFAEIQIARRRTRYERGPSGELTRKDDEVAGSRKSLTVDGMAPSHHVAIELVSRADYFDLGGVMSGSSVQSYDLKKVAAELAERMRKEGKRPIYFGVFYDPVSRMSMRRMSRSTDWKAVQARLQAESKTKLKAQVQDFVRWLQTQQAI